MLHLNADTIIAYLCAGEGEAGPERSYSPMNSNIGLDAETGALYAHYNRKTAVLYAPLFTWPGRVRARQTDMRRITYACEACEAEICFYRADAFLIRVRGAGALPFAQRAGEGLADAWTEARGDGARVRGYFRLTDARDSDERCPFALGVRALRGDVRALPGGEIEIAGEDALAAVAFALMRDPAGQTEALLQSAPASMEEAESACGQWLRACARALSLPVESRAEAEAVGKAARSLLMNLCEAPGALSGGVSAFPNRGKYPTLFLWDSCFQNLAYELFNPRLAADSLAGLARAQRPDGKIPQFVCSTWARPHASQPALMGWAARRLIAIPECREAALSFLPAIEKNCEWWRNSRVTRWGLVYSESGLESGWDDSPRYDRGPILALDMNSYLFDQMRFLAEANEALGQSEKAAFWKQACETLGARMTELLYDPKRNLFFDALADTGEKLPIVTPAALLPLWAGAFPDGARAKEMIENCLLNPDLLFGPVPFPSVAYTDAAYQPEKWWRGPTWLPVAYLMLETLEKFGYARMARNARGRLLDIVLKDGNMSELFNSQTGEGLGGREQGWTAAIYIKMLSERAQKGGN